jgi:hypothetical protein
VSRENNVGATRAVVWPQAAVGFLEQKRVVAGYAELQEKLLANAPSGSAAEAVLAQAGGRQRCVRRSAAGEHTDDSAK